MKVLGLGLRLVVVLAASLFTFWVLSNLLLNVFMPWLVNGDPQRLQLRYAFAWWTPGRIHLRGFELRGQGRVDQWMVGAGSVSGHVDLDALWKRTLAVDDVRASDVSFRYRRRRTEPSIEPNPSPPIPGLSNPPDPIPSDARDPRGPWTIALSDVRIDGPDEVWIEGYQLLGTGSATGDLVLTDRVDADLNLDLTDGELRVAGGQAAQAVQGQIALHVDRLVRLAPLEQASLSAIDADVALTARADGLGFLDFYLQKAPWLEVDGRAGLAMDVHMAGGQFLPGSRIAASTDDLSVGVLGYRIVGDGAVTLEVFGPDRPESRLALTFGAYTIQPGQGQPLIRGRGFEVRAVSPDTAVDRPFTGVQLAFDLPRSEIVSFERFDRFLPEGTISLRGGTGLLVGHLEANEAGIAHGRMKLAANDVRASLDDFVVTTDLTIEGRVSSNLLAGVYDLSHTTVTLDQLGVDAGPAGPSSPRDWWGRFSIPEGAVRVGADPYLDAWIAFRCGPLAPFLDALIERGSVPGWVRGILKVPEARGTSRLRLGPSTITLGPLDVTAGAYQLRMSMVRRHHESTGNLFARYHSLAMGLGFSGKERHFHLFNAADWYRDQGGIPLDR